MRDSLDALRGRLDANDAALAHAEAMLYGVSDLYAGRRVDPRDVTPCPSVVAFEDIPAGAPISIDFTLGLASRRRGPGGEPLD